MSAMLQDRPARSSRPSGTDSAPTSAAAPSSGPAATRTERSVSEIIARVRTAPAPFVGGLGASLATAALLWGAFYPLDGGALGWLAPVPLLLLVRIAQPTRRMYLAVSLGGAAYWVVTLSWMRLGDDSMIVPWLALAVYLALYFPASLALTRHAVERFRLPLAIAAPIVWVGLEYLRGHLLTGFSWYLLGHSQRAFLSLIQISDLWGAYGVSFLMLVSAAAVAECLPARWFAALRLAPPVCDLATAVRTATPLRQTVGVLASVSLAAAAVLYGSYRIEQGTFRAGPRVALIQGDFKPSVKHDPNAAGLIHATHFQLTGMAVKHRPDLIVWPESMYPFPLYLAEPGLSEQRLTELFPRVPASYWTDPRADAALALRDRAEQAGTALIIGLVTAVATEGGGWHHNSAAFVEPGRGITPV